MDEENTIDLQEYKVSLPIDLFRNTSTWMIYEMCELRLPLIILMLCFLIGFAVVFFTNLSSPWMLLLCMMISFSIGLPGLVAVFLRQLAIDKNKIKLADTILKSGPLITYDTWDKIAYDMNLFLYREHRWNSPYFFYNGEQCLHIFQQSVLIPFELGELGKELNENERRCIMEVIELYRSDY